jgi:hypothetical protein
MEDLVRVVCPFRVFHWVALRALAVPILLGHGSLYQKSPIRADVRKVVNSYFPKARPGLLLATPPSQSETALRAPPYTTAPPLILSP